MGTIPFLPPGARAEGQGWQSPDGLRSPMRVAVPRAWVCPLLEETPAPLGPTHLSPNPCLAGPHLPQPPSG